MLKINQYSTIIIVYSFNNAIESEKIEELCYQISKENIHSKVEILCWNETQMAEKKEYQRTANEWIKKDFNFFGKLRNAHIKSKLAQEFDLFIVFGSNYPKKPFKFIQKIKAKAKWGFERQWTFLDLCLLEDDKKLETQIDMLKKYAM
jgi:hypothetical protein